MTDKDTTETPAGLTQRSYRGTPYEDSSWEIVGEFLNQTEFEPLAFDVVGEESHTIDPMFADYGGRHQSGAKTRHHLPSNENYCPTRRQSDSPSRVVEEDPSLIKMTQDQLNQMLQQAAHDAREAAIAQTIAQGDERLQGVESRYGAIIHDISVQLNEHLRVVEQKAVALALQISEKLIGAAVEVNPEYILDIVRNGLAQVGGAAVRTVRVSPQDMEFLNLVNLPKHFKDFDGSWSFQADETIKAGCVVMTSAGEVDFQLDSAWERIKDQVVKVS